MREFIKIGHQVDVWDGQIGEDQSVFCLFTYRYVQMRMLKILMQFCVIRHIALRNT